MAAAPDKNGLSYMYLFRAKGIQPPLLREALVQATGGEHGFRVQVLSSPFDRTDSWECSQWQLCRDVYTVYCAERLPSDVETRVSIVSVTNRRGFTDWNRVFLAQCVCRCLYLVLYRSHDY